jgi:predicted transcriptional regulator
MEVHDGVSVHAPPGLLNRNPLVYQTRVYEHVCVTRRGARCCRYVRLVLRLLQMRKTMTIRLPDELAEWLNVTAQKTGLSQGRLIRQQLENARNAEKRPFLRLAGTIVGPADLSNRKGFSQGGTRTRDR